MPRPEVAPGTELIQVMVKVRITANKMDTRRKL